MLVTEIATPYDLLGAVRSALTDTPYTEPEQIADHLIDSIPEYELRQVLRTLLPSYVRQRMSAERVLTTPQQAQQIMYRSAKVDGITEWWRRVLEDRVQTNQGHKRLGDCTGADLEYIAALLRKKAESFVAKAQRYEKLRAHLPVNKPEATVSSLGKDVIQSVLGTFPDGTTSIDDDL